MESMSKELFKELDRDLDGAVTFEEFYKAHYEEPPLAHDYHALHGKMLSIDFFFQKIFFPVFFLNVSLSL